MGDISENFSRHEFACSCGCGFDVCDIELVSILERVRRTFGKPVTITSGCRCESHNRDVGGRPKSQHRLGKAADISVQGVPSSTVYQFLAERYPHQYGIGVYKTWCHLDVRATKARWDKRK